MSAEAREAERITPGGRPAGRGWRISLLVLATLLATASPGLPQAGSSVEETGMELTKVSPQLRLLHGAWQNWTQAYYQGDRQAASDATERLRAIVEFLGMSYLPDLSLAAATFAVRSAQEGDFEHSRWVLADARALDPGRPEVDFAAAAVKRLEGDWIGAGISAVRGYARLLRLPLERSIWIHDVGLRLLLVVLLAGCVFVALEIALRGSALYRDLVELAPRSMPGPLVLPAIVFALLWPLLLPAGVLWLALYWSVLIWGYGSASERIVLLSLWIVLGTTPLALSYQQSRLQLAFIPPARALDNLAADRLYGALFSDLGVLRAMTPGNSAVLELVADLHRRFDQWEEARPIYTQLANDLEQGVSRTAAPLNNLGLYHLRNKDYGTAVDYFRRASEADPDSVEAFYNLNQAYSRMFEFGLSNDALDRANELDRDKVDRWKARQDVSGESGVGIDGGLAQTASIREDLRSAWRTGDQSVTLFDLWRRHLSLSIAAAAILLAVVLYLMRRQLGLSGGDDRKPSGSALERWSGALIPGLRSLRDGRGGRAFCGIAIFVGLVSLAALEGPGYRPPLGYDPGRWFVAAAGLIPLVLWLAVRVGRNLVFGAAGR